MFKEIHLWFHNSNLSDELYSFKYSHNSIKFKIYEFSFYKIFLSSLAKLCIKFGFSLSILKNSFFIYELKKKSFFAPQHEFIVLIALFKMTKFMFNINFFKVQEQKTNFLKFKNENRTLCKKRKQFFTPFYENFACI